MQSLSSFVLRPKVIEDCSGLAKEEPSRTGYHHHHHLMQSIAPTRRQLQLALCAVSRALTKYRDVLASCAASSVGIERSRSIAQLMALHFGHEEDLATFERLDRCRPTPYTHHLDMAERKEHSLLGVSFQAREREARMMKRHIRVCTLAFEKQEELAICKAIETGRYSLPAKDSPPSRWISDDWRKAAPQLPRR